MDQARGTVLVVDDDEVSKRVLGELVRDRGFEVAEAASGQAAVEYLERSPAPTVILLDLIMPEMSGWEFLAWRRSSRVAADIPVIVLSGASRAEVTVGLSEGGASVGFLEKPFEVERLLALIERFATGGAPKEPDVAPPGAADFTGVLRMLADTVTDCASYGLDPGGRVTTWNAGAERLLGYEAAEIVGRHASVFYTPPDLEAGHCAASLEAAARDDRHASECWRVRRDGSRFWAHVVITAMRGARGELVGFGVVAGDMTERRKAEEDLGRLFELSQDMLCTTGHDGLLRRVNPAWTRVLGHTRDELRERPYLDLVHPDDRERTAAQVASLASGMSTVSYEGRFRCRDGSHRWLQWSATSLPVHGQIFCVGRDVTERKAVDEQLRQTQKMEAIGRLAGGMAHDFNNLLTAIEGFTDLALERLGPGDPIREYIEHTRRAGLRAAELTKQLLAFSRKQVLQSRVVSVNAIVTGLLDMLRRLIPESVAVVTSCAPDAGNVKADRGQLEQVVMNLAINARDAMPHGGKVTIATRRVELDATDAAAHAEVTPGPHVLLSITDTGSGMDLETRRHLFEPFFSTKKDKGTGLGLATVFGIVRQSGGHIRVESEVGRGTTFMVFLPQVDEVPVPFDPAARASQPRGWETILIVEDDAAVRNLVREVLTARGYRVVLASNGAEALELLARREAPVHLVLTDVIMPRMSGRTLADRLVVEQGGAKVLFMSGYLDTALLDEGAPGSPVAFIQKPFTPDALVAKIRDLLDAGDGTPRPPGIELSLRAAPADDAAETGPG